MCGFEVSVGISSVFALPCAINVSEGTFSLFVGPFVLMIEREGA